MTQLEPEKEFLILKSQTAVKLNIYIYLTMLEDFTEEFSKLPLVINDVPSAIETTG